MESLFTTMLIDAYEGCDIRTYDVLWVYFHAEFPKEKNLLLKLRGDFVGIMCDANPEHIKNVI